MFLKAVINVSIYRRKSTINNVKNPYFKALFGFFHLFSCFFTKKVWLEHKEYIPLWHTITKKKGRICFLHYLL